jgi:hypothetical protein
MIFDKNVSLSKKMMLKFGFHFFRTEKKKKSFPWRII